MSNPQIVVGKKYFGNFLPVKVKVTNVEDHLNNRDFDTVTFEIIEDHEYSGDESLVGSTDTLIATEFLKHYHKI